MSDDAWEKLAFEILDRATAEGAASRAICDGDRECSDTMIEIARHELRQGGEVSEVVREYLTTCLDRMAEGEDPAKVFGRKAPRRGPRPDLRKLQRDAELAFLVHHFVSNNMTVLEATNIVAEQYQDHPNSLAQEVGKLKRDAIEATYYRFYPSDS